MSSRKKHGQTGKAGSSKKSARKTSNKPSTVVPTPAKAKYSKYTPLFIAAAAAVFGLLITFILGECTAAFRVLFTLSVGLIGGCLAIDQNRMKQIEGKFPHIYIIISGAISFLGLLSIFAFMGVYPFGENSVATSDMTQQYIPFYASLRRILFDGEGFLYSQELGMGGNYWSIIGYYLCSPFVLLSLFFSKEALPDFMAIQELIKVTLAGCSFAYFYSRKFSRRDITVPLVSLCYSMMSFVMLHMCTIIWTDCLVLLPLIILGLENIIKGKRPWLYIACFTLSWISNYYISYIISIYLLLYYIAEIFIENEKPGPKKIVRSGLKFIGSSLLSVGMAMFVLLPSAFAVTESASSGDKAAEGLFAFNPLKILSQFMYNSETDTLSENSLPLVYCSIFALTFAILFFACKGISARVKTALGGLFVFLILSLTFNRLNFVWHAFHIPNKLPYRFAFLLCFTLLIMAGYVLKNFEQLSSNTFTFSFIGLIAAALAVYFINDADNFTMLMGTLGFAVIYTVILVLKSEKKLYPPLAMGLAVCVLFAEVTTNGALSLSKLSQESAYSVKDEYIAKYTQNSAAAEQIKVSDSDIYRIEMLSHSSINDSAMLGYGSISCFASTNNGGLLNLLKRVGYSSDERTTYYYKSFTPLMDSVMNLKYIVYGEDVGDPPYLDTEDTITDRFIYRNTLALPRAFAVSNSLTDWDIDKTNPFDVQNSFVQKALDTEDVVYKNEILTPNESLTRGVNIDDGLAKFSEDGGTLLLNYTADSRKHMYAYINCLNASSVKLAVAANQYQLADNDVYVMDLGYCNEGENITISITSPQELDGYIYLASLNEDVLEQSIERMGTFPAEFKEYENTGISCNVTVQNDCLLFTSIPYERSWSVYVNGEKTDIKAVGGGLIGVPLSAGQNTVEMKYQVRGLTAGIAISAISLAAAVLLLLRKQIHLYLNQHFIKKH